jgi:hypothetical protein
MRCAIRTALREERRRSPPPAALTRWERWYERPRFRMWAVYPSIAPVACKTKRGFRRSMRVSLSSNPLRCHCRQDKYLPQNSEYCWTRSFWSQDLLHNSPIHTLLVADLLTIGHLLFTNQRKTPIFVFRFPKINVYVAGEKIIRSSAFPAGSPDG